MHAHTIIIHHSELCKTNKRAIEIDRKSWKEQFPGFCPDCNGWGNETGEEQKITPELQLCTGCTAINRCGRCGRETMVNGMGPCSYCDWNHDDGVPVKPECLCDLEEWETNQ